MFVRRLVATEAVRPCQSTYACPDIWELADGDFAVIGSDITELASQLPPTAGCAPYEKMVRVPRALLIAAKAAIPDSR